MKLPNIFEKDSEYETYAAGVVIFSAGDPGSTMYVVREGEVEIKIGDTVLETVGPDGFFGEMALIEPGPRAAGAVAKSDCKLAPINERRFQFMVQEVPNFAKVIMQGLVRRLRKG